MENNMSSAITSSANFLKVNSKITWDEEKYEIIDNLEHYWEDEPALPYEGLNELRLLEGDDVKYKSSNEIIFIRPSSIKIPSIWYKYLVDSQNWEWTPYNPDIIKPYEFNIWIPISNIKVCFGKFKGKTPAKENLLIIETLNKPETKKLVEDFLKIKYKISNKLWIEGIDEAIILGRESDADHFAMTNAYFSITMIEKKLLSGIWLPNRPIVVAQYGDPGTGKNLSVKNFALNLWKNCKKKNPNFKVPFQFFFREHNFATMTTKESINKFMGASKGYEGGAGDLVKEISEGAQVFHLDEFHLADETIIKAFGGIFENGNLNDNSGTYVECLRPTVFFLSANFFGDNKDRQIELAKKIIKNKEFYQEENQSKIQNQNIREDLAELKKLIFSGTLAFIGDRCFESLLTYQPPYKKFRKSLVNKFLADASSKNINLQKIKIAWTDSVINFYCKLLDSGLSNRECRSKILSSVLDSITELKENSSGLFILHIKNEELDGKLIEWTDSLKQKVEECSRNDVEEIKVESKEEIYEIQKKKYLQQLELGRLSINPNVLSIGKDSKAKPKLIPEIAVTNTQNEVINKSQMYIGVFISLCLLAIAILLVKLIEKL